MTRYTVGFVFSADRQFVALIEKQRPKWQAGKFNGIGGHVEESDMNVAAAQSREFKEETGVLIPAEKWQAFANLVGVDYHVRCFVAFTDEVFSVKSMTDERVIIFAVSEIPDLPVITNLQYLIPLALDAGQAGVPTFNYAPRIAR